MNKKILIGLMCLVVLFIIGCSGNESEITGSAVASPEGSVVKIPLDQISRDVQHFDYDANGVTVTYFAVLGSDGEVRTAFDACDVCGGYKGYQQTGNDITCRNCGRVFSINGLGSKNKGYGCWPSYLSHTIEDGNVIIKTAELDAGKHRFA